MMAILLRQKRREREQVRKIESLSSELLDVLAENTVLKMKVEELEKNQTTGPAGRNPPSLAKVIEGLCEAKCLADRIRYEEIISEKILVVHGPIREGEPPSEYLGRWRKAFETIGFAPFGIGPADETGCELRALWRGEV